MERGLHPFVFVAVFAAMLFSLAVFLPSNSLTGNVILDGSCRGLGCSELCDQVGGTCSEEGMTCCATMWSTGV